MCQKTCVYFSIGYQRRPETASVLWLVCSLWPATGYSFAMLFEGFVAFFNVDLYLFFPLFPVSYLRSHSFHKQFHKETASSATAVTSA